MAFCRHCGAALAEGAFFCKDCGEPVSPPEGAVGAGPASASPLADTRGPRSADVTYAVVLVLAIALLQVVEVMVDLADVPGSDLAAALVYGSIASIVPLVVGGIVATGLWRRRMWARWLAIGLGVFEVLGRIFLLVRGMASPAQQETSLTFTVIELVLLAAAGWLLLKPGAGAEYR